MYTREETRTIFDTKRSSKLMVSVQCLNFLLIVLGSPLDEVVSETFVSLHHLRDPNLEQTFMTHGGGPMGHWQPEDGKYCNFLRVITTEPSVHRRSFLLDVKKYICSISQ